VRPTVSARPRAVAFVRNVMVGRQGLSRERLLAAFGSSGAVGPVSSRSATRSVTAVVFAVTGRDAYSVTHIVDGRTVAPGPLLERATGRRVTTRSWRTIEMVVRRETGR
jgi:hypothetical protein